MEEPGAALAVLFVSARAQTRADSTRAASVLLKGPSLLTRCLDAARRLRAIRVSIHVELPREPGSRVEVSS